MSQSSFVLEKDLQFIDAGFLAKHGDVFVYTPPQTVVIYRNGDLKIQMAITQAAIDGLLINGSLKRIPAAQEAPQKPEPAPEVPQTPAPEPPAPETPQTPAPEVPQTPVPEEPVASEAPAPETPAPEGEGEAEGEDEAPAEETPAEGAAPVKKPRKSKK